MSDETPPAADGPDATTPDAGRPDDATPADATEPAAVAAPTDTPAPVATAAPATKASRSGVEVPRWLAIVVAAALLVGVGFAIGWFAAPGGSHTVISVPAGRQFPAGPGGPFSGSGPIGRQVGGAFLGVETSATSGSTPGAPVVSVVAGGPAAQAGLQAGDVITAVNGSSVTSVTQLSQDIASHQPGDQVTITYSRNGTSSQASVKLGSRPAPSASG